MTALEAKKQELADLKDRTWYLMGNKKGAYRRETDADKKRLEQIKKLENEISNMSKFKVATLTASQIAALPKQAQEDIATLKKDTRNYATNYSTLKDADDAFYAKAMELLSKKQAKGKGYSLQKPKATTPTATASVNRNTSGTAKPRKVKRRTTARAQVADKKYYDAWEKLGRSKPATAKLKPITAAKSKANHAKARELLLAKYPGAKKVVPAGSCIGVWQTTAGKKIDYAHFLSLAMGGKG